jgi:hypothetical protein
MTNKGGMFNLPFISNIYFTDNFMYSFAQHTEEVIEGGIEKFETKGPENYGIEICPDERIYSHVEFYQGLTNEDVILDEIFKEYFPSLSRRAAFQTIYST